MLLERERVVARERIEQARARGERSDRGHELRERNDGEAHERELRADRVVVELRDRDRVRRAGDGGDALHGEEQCEHVCEADEPRAGDAAHDGDGREELGALCLLGDLCGGLAALERVYGLQEAEEDDEAAVAPASEAMTSSA